MKKIIILLIILSLFAFNILPLKQKINLPEEYKLISNKTPIKGYFDKDSILHIEFDNSIQFKWEGLEKDIPQDGDKELNLSTNENIIYLNPVDK